MKIFLIGMPGSGKTTLGKLLAAKLKLPFVDLDAEVEKAEGWPINKIFAREGEDYFRRRESAILNRYCASAENFIMSTGGGVPCFHDNMKAMNDCGKTIFLDVPVATIVSRLAKTNLDDRPLFANLRAEQLIRKIELLRAQRIIFYQSANYSFEGSNITAEQIIKKITD